MASTAVTGAGGFLRKYGAVIFFPTFAISTILADWTHTRAWKREQKDLKKKSENLRQYN